METNFEQQIKALMAGKKKFTIFLKKPADRTYIGAIAQSSSAQSEFEVWGEYDKVDFSTKEKVTTVIYTRVYSDMPPSVQTFLLNDIASVEEKNVPVTT